MNIHLWYGLNLTVKDVKKAARLSINTRPKDGWAVRKRAGIDVYRVRGIRMNSKIRTSLNSITTFRTYSVIEWHYTMFMRFVIFSLLFCLSHEISDKISSRSSKLLRGFNTREVQPQELSKQSENVPRFLLNLYRKRMLLHRSGLNQRESDIVRVFFRERKYTLENLISYRM